MTPRLREVAGKPRYLTGWKRDSPDPLRDKRMTVSWRERLALPRNASLRKEPGLVVEDQDSIGSCTCNAGTTAHEFVLRRHGMTVQLSRLWAYAKVREFEGTPLTEDSGAQIRNVMKVLAKWGCPPEPSWPYDLRKWTANPPASLEGEAAYYRLSLYFRCDTLPAIKASIAQGFPVVGGFMVPENMMTDRCANSGIVMVPTAQERFEGGHAVLFTGYNDATRRLEFQNSWSTGWGDRGYGYLPYDFTTLGLADDFWTIRRSLPE